MKKINCILLIDDNSDDNFFHTITIEENGAAQHIKTATTGETALEYLKQAKLNMNEYPMPDLIFLDINMPGMNGFEFLEKAKNLKMFHQVKTVIIVMLTSSLNPNDEKMAKEVYANEIMEFRNKPLSTEALKEIIEKFF